MCVCVDAQVLVHPQGRKPEGEIYTYVCIEDDSIVREYIYVCMYVCTRKRGKALRRARAFALSIASSLKTCERRGRNVREM